jgi:hypothetical protein
LRLVSSRSSLRREVATRTGPFHVLSPKRRYQSNTTTNRRDADCQFTSNSLGYAASCFCVLSRWSGPWIIATCLIGRTRVARRWGPGSSKPLGSGNEVICSCDPHRRDVEEASNWGTSKRSQAACWRATGRGEAFKVLRGCGEAAGESGGSSPLNASIGIIQGLLSVGSRARNPTIPRRGHSCEDRAPP